MAKTKSTSSIKKTATVKIKSTKTGKNDLKVSGKKLSDKNSGTKNATIKKAVKKTGIAKPKETVKKVQPGAIIPIEKKIKKHKPNKKVKYTLSELKHFREIILKERKSILESAKANMDALVDKDSGEYKGVDLTYSTHMAEQGTDEMEREKNYLFVQRDEKYLGYLQDALTRIDQGTYGICTDCKDDPKNLCRTCPLIQKERLELVPITQHCIECKNLRG
ncbi:MAG: conjugal transfer protein TraR [Ignavibacteria bacterium]